MRRIAPVVLVFTLILLPAAARGQSATSSAIAGVVRDTTGAVLPGVTVEAASPALIEKVRSVVTDDQGQYKIVDLRIGTYTVSFSLTGFKTVKREGIELTTGFTATANADMAVGSLEETITVTGASPTVDVQNVRSRTVMSRETLDSIPTSRMLDGYANLTLGASVGIASQNVGGARGEFFSTVVAHGSRSGEFQQKWDGFNFMLLQGNGAGSASNFKLNQAMVQEVSLATGGATADSDGGGVQLNAVPKDGGNNFSLYINTSGSTPDLQSRNLDDDLRALGVTQAVSIKKLYDFDLGLGGPIVKDRLWYYTAHRWWGAQEYVPGNYFNKTQHTFVYTPDLSRPAYVHKPNSDDSVRMTWQASQKNKVTGSFSYQRNCHCFWEVDNNRAPEASPDLHYYPSYLTQVTWTYPSTSRLLFEAGVAVPWTHIEAVRGPDSSPDDIALTEATTGYIYNSFAVNLVNSASSWARAGSDVKGDWERQSYQRFSASYITGSHAFKTGVSLNEGRLDFDLEVNKALSYVLRNGLPISLTQWASPMSSAMVVNPALGIFAQDQWTISKLTLNLGLRFDAHKSHNPEQTAPGGIFYPATTFGRVDNVPNWRDINPRFGAAYDLFGNGKTAIKGYLGRYVSPQTVGIAITTNPSNALVSSASRTWADANADFNPDCNLQSVLANGECGPLSNTKFGTSNPTIAYDTNLTNGWGKRGYNWQGSVALQHELAGGVALNVGYFRTWYGNFVVTDNLRVAPTDYDPFCVTAPTDARLDIAGVTGQQVCGLADIRPSVFGLVDNLVTRNGAYGDQLELFNGLDIGLNARFGNGASLNGGVSTGRLHTNNCYAVDSPQQRQADSPFCNVVPPLWAAGTQIKLNGAYPLPWDLQVSGTYQNLPGLNILATQVYTNAQILPSLGRNLGQCGTAAVCNGTATINLIPPNQVFNPHLQQVDLRLTKRLRLGRARLQGMFDAFNVFNANDVLQENPAFGPTWRKPVRLMSARLFKFGMQLDF